MAKAKIENVVSLSMTNLRILKITYLVFFILFVLCGCAGRQTPVNNIAFHEDEGKELHAYDWEDILGSGELIIATMSGPDTYYDFQGQYLGLQYALAENFAVQNGLRVRVELAHDEKTLFRMLKGGDVDIICYLLKDSLLLANGFQPAGATDERTKASWAVREDATGLVAALREWYGKGVELEVERAEKAKMKARRQVRRKVRAPYVSRAKGIISAYDDGFKRAARLVGWDWKLLAAQCYQESGFDPSAESWAGARGLMQIMPATAAHLGLAEDKIFDGYENIAAAARYLRELDGHFSDIRSGQERIKFVLAAYNGGPGHVRDAMALTRKYGRNPHLWSEVSEYLLKLSNAKYYRDPLVKYGYMISSETYNYVISIWDRWRAYGGRVGSLGQKVGTEQKLEVSEDTHRPHRQNRYTKGTRIYGPDDPEFNRLNP